MIFDNNIYVLLALVVAFLVAFSATPMVISLAHKVNAIDVPKDARRVHKKADSADGRFGNILWVYSKRCLFCYN